MNTKQSGKVVFSLQTLFDTVESITKKYIDLWEEICNIESPTNCKSGVDAVGNRLVHLAKGLGWSVERLSHPIAGDALCLTLNPDAKEIPVALSGHMDTVHPVGLFGSPAVHMDEKRIYGPGVSDCKGGIVAACLAMEALQLCGFCARPVRLILQSDEEVSSILSDKTTIAFMAEKAKDCIAFLNTEPTANPGKITVERKGIIRYVFDIHGIAAHSSKCDEGASAISEAAHKIIELEKWKDGDGITCTCGVIEGGSAPNTVAERCTFMADIRYKTPEQLACVQQRVREIADTVFVEGTTCTLTVKSERVCGERTKQNVALFEKANAILQRNGFGSFEMRGVKGGSDASNLSALGIPCLDSLGVHGGKIHSKDEYAELYSLPLVAKQLAALVHEL